MEDFEFAPEVRWFAWREVQEALAFGRTGHIALHYFRYDLRRFGLGMRDPCCHVMSADRESLVGFASLLGLPEWLLKPPKPHRPDVWHYDAFGWALNKLEGAYPLPEAVDHASLESDW